MKADRLTKYLELAKPALFNAKLNSGGSVPHLSCFCFLDGMLIAYDGVMGISIQCPEVEVDGGCINGESLIALVKSMGKEDIGVYAEKENIFISGQRTKVHLPMIDADEYPYKHPKITSRLELDLTPAMIHSLDFCNQIVLNPKAADRAALSCVTLVSSGRSAHSELYSTNNQIICVSEVEPTQKRVRKKGEDKKKPKTQVILLPGAFCSRVVEIYRYMGGRSGTLTIGKNSLEALISNDDGELLATVHSSMMEDIKSFPFERTVEDLMEDVEDMPGVPVSKALLASLKRSADFVRTGLSYTCTLALTDTEAAVVTMTANGEIEDTIGLEDPHEEDVEIEINPKQVHDSLKGCSEFHASERAIVGYTASGNIVLVSAREGN